MPDITHNSERFKWLFSLSVCLIQLAEYVNKELQSLRATTVDSFQGEENTIIILSLVRCNPSGKIGFLRMANRACVALSRARNGESDSFGLGTTSSKRNETSCLCPHGAMRDGWRWTVWPIMAASFHTLNQQKIGLSSLKSEWIKISTFVYNAIESSTWT